MRLTELHIFRQAGNIGFGNIGRIGKDCRIILSLQRREQIPSEEMRSVRKFEAGRIFLRHCSGLRGNIHGVKFRIFYKMQNAQSYCTCSRADIGNLRLFLT